MSLILLVGITDQHYEEAYTRESSTPNLPSVGDWAVVIVTALISATEFFIQLPLGCVHPLHLVNDNENRDSKCKCSVVHVII